MQRAAELTPGAMAAVLGLSASDVAAVCRETEASGAGPVQPANYNGGGQVVISGVADAVAKAGEIAKAHGAKRVVALNVSGAFHSPLMSGAAEAMSHVIADSTIGDASVPVVANFTADYQAMAADIKSNLAAQIDHPVRWEETIVRLTADGFDTFVEVGPGTVLSGMMKRLAPGKAVYSIGDSGSLAGFLTAIEPRTQP
jgi:[acyl-carrier-protein] S-malonyltransferase